VRTCPECQNHYEDEILHCPEDGYNLTGIEPVDEMIGRTVGSYKVTKALGKGGMGAVYAGLHPVIGSKVAIKFLHPQYATDQKIVDRFFNEAKAVNIIGHDNVLKILDLNVTDDNRHYFVMEYLAGRSLQSLVRPNEPLPLEVTGPMLLQICAALQAAHDKRIIHRDLKPDNVYLITLNGRKNFVKVVDFGIAKLSDTSGNSTGKTQTGMVMGTPAYMSPEQGSGETNKIDARSDIYSLGVMMYQMATGKLPFPGSNFGEVLMGHLQRPPPPPRAIVPAIPEEYEQIILKALAKQQDDRFQSMNELHDAIFNLMQVKGISAELPLADQTEELDPVLIGAPSNPGQRTPSRPGKTNPPRGTSGGSGSPRTSQPPKQLSGAPRPPTRPGGAGRSVSGHTRPPPQEAKSKLPFVLGGVILLLVAGGGVAFSMKNAADRKAEEERVRVATEKAKKLQQEVANAESAPIFLSVISEPLGADVEATWKEGTKSGATPLSIEAPKGSKVHFEFKKEGFAPYTVDALADQPQTVTAVLKPNAAARPAEPEARAQAQGEPAPAGKKGGKKKPSDLPAQKDGLIDLGDAFK
jgi:serine/threonine protein kinase